MKIVDKIDDSFGSGERIIYIIEIDKNTFIDVMVINDDIHSENYLYIMDFDGGQAYIKTTDGDKGIDYLIIENEIFNFIYEEIGIF